jgi:GNAT superfamily N-acetyltransferase
MTLQIIRTRHPPEAYIDQLAALNTEAGAPTPSSDLRRRLNVLPREDRLLLAVEGDQLIGYAHLRVAHDLTHEETAEVVSIVVHTSRRREGIGRRLISAAETWARESGKARLLLHTDVVRTDAHAFYVALGYREANTMIEFVRDLERDRRSEAPTQPPSEG